MRRYSCRRLLAPAAVYADRVALPFIPSDAAVLALQAAVVAAPKPAPRLAIAERLRGPAWALVPIGSIVVVVFAIRYLSDTASGLTYLALVAVPPLAAAALGWAARGSRAPAAVVAVPLFAIAWAVPKTLVGEGAAVVLEALSCVTLGVLLAAVTPTKWLKFGIVAMACADTWLVVSDLLDQDRTGVRERFDQRDRPKQRVEQHGDLPHLGATSTTKD